MRDPHPKAVPIGCDSIGRVHGRESFFLTDEQIATVREAWDAGATQAEICRLIGVSIDILRSRFRDQLKTLPPRDRRAASGRRPELPTPQEIEVECAALRKSWTPDRFGLVDEPEEEAGHRLGRCREFPSQFHVERGRLR